MDIFVHVLIWGAGCVALGVVWVALALSLETGWGFALLAAYALGYPIFAWRRINSERDRERAAAAEQARQERLRAEQANEQSRLRALQLKERDVERLGSQALEAFAGSARHLDSAQSWTTSATRDFEEGAFNPFWESIENAMRSLGEFDRCVETMRSSAIAHQHAVAGEANPPRFPLTASATDELQVARAISDKLDELARRAHRDPNYATIFTQRRTNDILVAGFRGLAQALNGMSQHLGSSIDGLRKSVDSSSESTQRHLSSQASADAARGDRTVALLREIRNKLD